VSVRLSPVKSESDYMLRFVNWLEKHEEFLFIFALPLGLVAFILLLGRWAVHYIRDLINTY